MAPILEETDLPDAVRDALGSLARAVVDGLNGRVSRVAPCLTWDGSEESMPAPSPGALAEAKLILIGVAKRWSEAGSGAFQSQTAGPFGVTMDTRQRSGFNLWPSEITDLQDICKEPGMTGRQAFSVDTASDYVSHLPWCSQMFGATYCSCGVDIAGEPIYELG